MASQIARSSGRFALPWGGSRTRLQLLRLAIGIIAIGLVPARAQSPVVLQADLPGIGIEGQRFMIATPIANGGTVSATNVRVTGATWGSADLISPGTFPVLLGTISPGNRYVFQTDFDATGLEQDTLSVLTITGTYQVNEVNSNFTLTLSVGLPPASPGSATAKKTTAHSYTVSGAPFTPPPPPSEAELNEPPPPIPISPFVPGTPTQRSTSVRPLPAPGAEPPEGDPAVSAVSINKNQGLGNLTGLAATGGTIEPSGASGGGVVLVSFNKQAAYSVEGGDFLPLNPVEIFEDGYQCNCSDQWIQYVSKIDRFIWLQQITNTGNNSPGAYRLAAASPATIKEHKGLKGWAVWLLTPEILTYEPWCASCKPDATDQLQYDFPSMSVGNNHLYITWDVGCHTADTSPCGEGREFGREVVRIPLEQIQDGHDINFSYTFPPDSGGCSSTGSCLAWGNFATQDTEDELFWPGHNGTKKLTVFSWKEDSDIYYWENVNLLASYVPNQPGGDSKHFPSLAPLPMIDQTPDKPDWLYRRPMNNILGATRSGDNIWFAWNAAPNGTLLQPYIEMVSLDRSANFKATQQVQIWNPDYAFALPSLARNACTGEIGLSLAYGGGGNYPNHAVGFWGDYVVYPTTAGDVTTSNYGDYLTIRQNHSSDLHGAFFDAFGYALTNAGSGGGSFLSPDQVNVDIRYVIFGRPGACAK